jgi:glycosyltransferase involved in cell wall biosynthesis
VITLRVIVEEMLSSVPSGTSRYTEELTRALIATAPPGCSVEGIVAASTEGEYADILDRLPGLSGLHKSPLARRQLVPAWQHGFTSMPGMVHAPTLLAPLSKHDRVHARGQQTVVTLHDVTAWKQPSSADARGAGWAMTMARRAHRYADALVVPTHAVARQLAEFLDFGDRVRVIGGAVSPSLAVPFDAEERAARLGLPAEGYLLALGGLEQRRGLDQLLQALTLAEAGDIPLLVVGPDDSGAGSIREAAAAAGLPEERVRALGSLGDPDFSVALDRATAFVLPSLLEGFGLQLLEAYHFGTPVIHSDTEALVEVAGDAGIVVELEDADGYPARLASAIGRVVGDPALAATLSTAGKDRAGLFDWGISAEKVWQLHADL